MRRNWLSEEDAERQAIAIEGYWRARGHDVRVWVERADNVPTKGSRGKLGGAWIVRSTLCSGLPQAATRRRLIPITVS
jgi:hypothetical protein